MKTEPEIKQSNQLKEIFPIEQTPFSCLQMNDKYYIICGRYRHEREFENQTQCENYALHVFDWQLINMLILANLDINNSKSN